MAGNRPTLYGMAFVVAIIVAITSAFLPLYFIPVITYIVSVLIGVATKYASCDKVEFGSSAKLAVLPTLFSVLMIGILSVLPSMKRVVETVMPAAGTPFYLFWSVLYGQIISGGMLQVC